MRTLTTICLMACMCSVSRAQLFTPESLGGAALGGVIGGVVGHNHHGQTAEGAAIGAGIGYLLGEATHAARRSQVEPAYDPNYYPYHQYSAYPSVGYAPVYSDDRPNLFYAPYRSRRPNFAWGGAALGGIAGAIIGNQVHGQTGEGAAIGAAAGLLLGGLAERQARIREAEAAAAAVPAFAVPQPFMVPAPEPETQPRVLIQRPTAPSGPMNGANRLFGR